MRCYICWKGRVPFIVFSFKSILASLISFFSIVQMWSNSRQIYTKLLMESHCLHIIDTELSSFSMKDSFQSLVKMMQVCLVSCLWMAVSWEMLASSGPFPSHHSVTWRCWLSARLQSPQGSHISSSEGHFHSPQTSPMSSWSCSFLWPLLSGFWFQRTSLLNLSPRMVCLGRALIYPPPQHSCHRDSNPPYLSCFIAWKNHLELNPS